MPGDFSERARQFRLAKDFTRLIETAITEENPIGVWKPGEQILMISERLAEPVAYWKTFSGWTNGGSHDAGKPECSIFALSESQAGHSSRNAGRQGSHNARLRNQVAVGIQVHIPGGCARRLFPIVDHHGFAGGHADEHEAAAADVAGERVGDSESKSHCDGCIHRVAASPQNFKPRLRGEWLACHHHTMLCGHGLVSSQWRSQCCRDDISRNDKKSLRKTAEPKTSWSRLCGIGGRVWIAYATAHECEIEPNLQSGGHTRVIPERFQMMEAKDEQ